MKILKLYLDSSIPNYVFAKHLPFKMQLTKKLFQELKQGKCQLFISDVVLRELMEAPEPKRSNLLAQVENLPQLKSTSETERLARKYIRQRIISENYFDDARHVAIATVYNLDAVVSWNYGHLVNINKIKGVGLINKAIGYKHIEIVTPEVIIQDE